MQSNPALRKVGAIALAVVCSLIGSPPAVAQAPANIQQAQIECVQKELNLLGFHNAEFTGVIDKATVDASKAYIEFMTASSPGWAMAVVGNENAEEWCQRTAEAHPRVGRFWREYQSFRDNGGGVDESAATPAATPAAGFDVAVEAVEGLKMVFFAVSGEDPNTAEVVFNNNDDPIVNRFEDKWYVVRVELPLSEVQQICVTHLLPEPKWICSDWDDPELLPGYDNPVVVLRYPDPRTADAGTGGGDEAVAPPADASGWQSLPADKGRCITVASPAKRDERITGEAKPQVYILNTPGQDANQFVVQIAGPVKQSQIFVEIDGVTYPTITLENGVESLLLVRATDPSGRVVLNEPSAYRLANRAIVQAMRRGQTLTAHVVVRDGPEVGTMYDEVYSLEGFAEAKAASDAACS